MKVLLCSAIAVMSLIVLCAGRVESQTCPGSHLNLIVRDEKGAVIENAWPDDLRFESEKIGDHEYKWSSEKFKIGRAAEVLPAGIAKLDDKAWMLTTTAWCVFENGLKLRLTRKGKTMNLMFTVPQLGQYESRDFIVDGPRFSEGDYGIVLSLPKDSRRENFFPASGWKKLTERMSF